VCQIPALQQPNHKSTPVAATGASRINLGYLNRWHLNCLAIGVHLRSLVAALQGDDGNTVRQQVAAGCVLIFIASEHI